ncbi:MAG: phage tail protein [Burkholderiales bacterium]|nr:phage tail protein [Burkholderiales bacterium]
MADQFIGEIRAFAFNYAPYEWAYCDGQQLPVQQNPALYAILGQTYGGNGASVFNLPDLRHRAVMGQTGGALNKPQGSATVTLSNATMAAHTHTLNGNIASSVQSEPNRHLPARFMEANNNAYVAANPPSNLSTLAPATALAVGLGQPHENQQPYQVLNFCIALNGAWPERP